MVCTFGDTTDVTWWRDLGLPTRPVLGPDGRLLADPPDWITEPDGQAAYAELAGLPGQVGPEPRWPRCSTRPVRCAARPSRSPTR